MFALLNKIKSYCSCLNFWASRFRDNCAGIAAVEFALFLPVALVLMVALLELGHSFSYAATVENGLRSGALFAARNDFPLTLAMETTAENLIKTGSVGGTEPFLVPGWGDAGANVDITYPTITVDGTAVPVVRIVASVPYSPLLPGLFSTVGVNNFSLGFTHEQVYLGR